MIAKTAKRPSLAWVCAKPWRFFAFGMGSGVIYPGPGTWGTVWGWLIWLAALQFMPLIWVPFFLLGSFLLGIWLCQKTGDELGVSDHGGMNWDEAVAIWLVLWAMPFNTWWMQVFAFVSFRFFDVIKPTPIRWFDQRVGGGFGVMLDDIIAALYSLLVMYGVAYFL
ncbi:MAG TPA: phosphatidylglycerophosphatase A [Paenalcaligenes hominis]|uniref:Phosphatidylglycerophosphatase A n=1 Tax=Paenalcaligenes hominis TaxID=643674 RepID=A0A9D3AAG7_9BURK|nr:phosphatidylglycerophosphatase A [Paenalcaligenes hominis]NJB65736.1 phosphatidylglycerophosphatase A [Paenalcaligenes hominis]GGE63397.1 phosphatidylglycerophosphatase A [Paenalcaligenes hominis]HJH23179.1 phosphatidylglycerophosphatase A [Paenalcaligenes hominis]